MKKVLKICGLSLLTIALLYIIIDSICVIYNVINFYSPFVYFLDKHTLLVGKIGYYGEYGVASYYINVNTITIVSCSIVVYMLVLKIIKTIKK